MGFIETISGYLRAGVMKEDIDQIVYIFRDDLTTFLMRHYWKGSILVSFIVSARLNRFIIPTYEQKVFLSRQLNWSEDNPNYPIQTWKDYSSRYRVIVDDQMENCLNAVQIARRCLVYGTTHNRGLELKQLYPVYFS